MRSSKTLCYILVALAAGCVPVLSLQPLFTEENMTFDERLLGAWVDDVNKPRSSWKFSRLSVADPNVFPEAQKKEDRERLYRLDFRDEEDHKGVFVAALGKLGDNLFLNIFPASFPSGETEPNKVKLAYNALFFLRVHTFIKVEAIGSQLKLRLTDDDKFKDLIKADPNAIKYDTVESQMVLTASTKDLQAFVIKYANDKRLFADEVVLSRKSSK